PTRFSTARLPFLSHIPDHTDLSFYHPGVASHLIDCDVIHTTDAFFAFAKTALKIARRHGIPLVNSIHTDTPALTQIYTAKTVERIFGQGLIKRLLLNGLKLHIRAERYMFRKLANHQRRCASVLVSKSDDYERACRVLPASKISFLRRGIDMTFFSPAKRDRAWLMNKFGIPQDRLVILFVGRLNQSKNIIVLAEAISQLIAQGLPLHLVCAGQGESRQNILDRLGSRASCPGMVLGDDLANLYANADIFAMPSEIEIFCNVVQEALASGLPVALAERGGMGRLIIPGKTGAVVSGPVASSWAATLKGLCSDRESLMIMSRAARAYAERELPTWDDVLNQDLLPVWQAAVAAKRNVRHGAAT
ncbi:MAG: glycosyltransferase, partial [Planctomycetota bacterium]